MSENLLVKKLQTVADLSADDREQLDQLCREVVRVQAENDIISQGDRPEHILLIVQGWAARYSLLPDGKRQITAFLIPGDFGVLHATVLGRMDHSIMALSPCKVAPIDSKEMDRLTSENNRLARALWWTTLVESAVQRQWIVSVGRRDAHKRIAHILCEMHARMKMVGLVENERLALPLTQEELADATGLTAVHTNRTLQRLRSENLIEIGRGMLTVLDVHKLREAGGFDPNYLHIHQRIR